MRTKEGIVTIRLSAASQQMEQNHQSKVNLGQYLTRSRAHPMESKLRMIPSKIVHKEIELIKLSNKSKICTWMRIHCILSSK